MKNLIFTCFFAALALAALPSVAAPADRNAQISRLRTELSKANTPKDSVRILYDIFDLSPRTDYQALARELWSTAGRAADITAQLDISRQITAILENDADFDRLESEVKKLPDSKGRNETLLFIEMKRVALKSRNIPDEERQAEMAEIISHFDLKSADRNSRVLDLFKVVEYLRNDVTGDMLKQYLDELYKLVETSDFGLYAIPNLVYSETALSYTAAADHAKAVAADRKLLNVIDGLEKKYAGWGRRFRNYDVSRFVSYRRMLRNFEALRPGEAQELHNKILRLSETDPDVRAQLGQNPYTPSFYLMATGRYKEAIPELRKLYEREQTVSAKRRALELLVKAAEKTGDENTRLYALEEYNSILEEYNRLNEEEHSRNLQLKYDVKSLQESKAQLELENRETEIQSTRRLMTFITVGFLLMAAAFAFSLFYWTRWRKNSFRIGTIAMSMTNERNRLRHSIFIDDDDETPAPEDHTVSSMLRDHRQNAKPGVDLSSHMTQKIVNNLIHIAMLGKQSRNRHIHEASADAIMRRSVSMALEKIDYKRSISVEYPEEDFSVCTDPESLVRILSHLLYATYLNTTDDIPVTFSCRRAGDDMHFIFTAEHYYQIGDDSAVFDTMVTAEELVNTPECGLFVDRIIALMLSGCIQYDKTYTDGTRFIYTTPADLKQPANYHEL